LLEKEIPVNIDNILAEHTKWIATLAQQAATGRATAAHLNFPEEMRQQRMADLQARIESLTARKNEMVKLYDRAIAQDRQELEALRASENSPIPKMESLAPNEAINVGNAAPATKSQRQK
jgi:hypothetical protein